MFRQSLACTENKKPYIFCDGPPFSTGLPHHGHLVGSMLNIVPRYWTMKRAGSAGTSTGCPSSGRSTKRWAYRPRKPYGKLAPPGTTRSARHRGAPRRRLVQDHHPACRWVDFDDDYKTMDVWYLESVWWVVNQIGTGAHPTGA